MTATIVIGVLLLAYAAWVAVRMWKWRGKCSCGCEGCAFSQSCHQKSK